MSPKKNKICLFLIALSIILSGCMEGPSSTPIATPDYVSSNTGIDNLHDEPKNYKKSLNVDNMTIDVDATVNVPDYNTFPIYHVQQSPFTDDLVSRLCLELANNTTLYDGHSLCSETKATLSSAIDILEKRLNGTSSIFGFDSNDYEERLEKYRALLEDAPENLYATEISNMAICEDPNEPNSSSLWAVTDGSDGTYISAAAVNTYSQSNYFIFTKGYHGFESTTVLPKIYDKNRFNFDYKISTYKEGSVSLTPEEASAIATSFLQNIGLSSFYPTSCDRETLKLLADPTPNSEHSILCIVQQDAYTLIYNRYINDSPVVAFGAGKHAEGWDGDQYMRKDWPNETIEFRINDDGIVSFKYTAPIEIVDTQQDSSPSLSFDDIITAFEDIAPEVCVRNNKTSVSVGQIVFGYSLVSDDDNWYSGELIPTWNFYTSSKNNSLFSSSSENVLFISISAIDKAIVYPADVG